MLSNPVLRTIKSVMGNQSMFGRWVLLLTSFYAVRSVCCQSFLCSQILIVVLGYTPFDRDSQQEEMEAICAGDYKFEPGA